MDDWCYEVPAGGVSAGLSPEEVAHRELAQEIGSTADDLQHIGQFYTSNGISNEVAYVYLATGVELGETCREPTELMETRLVPVEKALRMARNGEIADGPSALALLWCEPLAARQIAQISVTRGRRVTSKSLHIWAIAFGARSPRLEGGLAQSTLTWPHLASVNAPVPGG